MKVYARIKARRRWGYHRARWCLGPRLSYLASAHELRQEPLEKRSAAVTQGRFDAISRTALRADGSALRSQGPLVAWSSGKGFTRKENHHLSDAMHETCEAACRRPFIDSVPKRLPTRKGAR